MIFSSLQGTDTLAAYPGAVRKALAYLRETDILSLPEGQIDLDGDNMFVKVMDATTKPLEGSYPEVHRDYIDLFYWPEGGEKVGWAPFTGTEAVFQATPDKDVTLLENVEGESFLLAAPGSFALFFPWDAHRPGIMAGDVPETHRKCVVKISMKLL